MKICYNNGKMNTKQPKDGEIMLKIGDRVKAIYQINSHTRTDKGTVTDIYDDVVTVSIGNLMVGVLRKDVQLIQECSQEQLDAYVKDKVDELKSMISLAVDTLYPNDKISVKQDKDIIYIWGDSISVGPAICELKSIAKIIESPGWEVLEFESIPATRDQPEDVSESFAIKSTNLLEIVAMVCRIISEQKIRWYLERYMDLERYVDNL